ncbi:MAG: hypothetical protein WDA23_11335, partial [Gemmobacter sp.]
MWRAFARDKALGPAALTRGETAIQVARLRARLNLDSCRACARRASGGDICGQKKQGAVLHFLSENILGGGSCSLHAHKARGGRAPGLDRPGPLAYLCAI